MQSVDSIEDIPCFRCIVDEKNMLSPHRCDPAKCGELDEWLDGLVFRGLESMPERERRVPKIDTSSQPST